MHLELLAKSYNKEVFGIETEQQHCDALNQLQDNSLAIFALNQSLEMAEKNIYDMYVNHAISSYLNGQDQFFDVKKMPKVWNFLE